MLVKALKPVCGPTVHLMAGQQAEIDDELAGRLIALEAVVEVAVPKPAVVEEKPAEESSESGSDSAPKKPKGGKAKKEKPAEE
jgi:hypothetical protein